MKIKLKSLMMGALTVFALGCGSNGEKAGSNPDIPFSPDMVDLTAPAKEDLTQQDYQTFNEVMSGLKVLQMSDIVFQNSQMNGSSSGSIQVGLQSNQRTPAINNLETEIRQKCTLIQPTTETSSPSGNDLGVGSVIMQKTKSAILGSDCPVSESTDSELNVSLVQMESRQNYSATGSLTSTMIADFKSASAQKALGLKKNNSKRLANFKTHVDPNPALQWTSIRGGGQVQLIMADNTPLTLNLKSLRFEQGKGNFSSRENIDFVFKNKSYSVVLVKKSENSFVTLDKIYVNGNELSGSKGLFFGNSFQLSLF